MILNQKKAVFLDRDGVLNNSDVVEGKPYAPRKLDDFIIEKEDEIESILSKARESAATGNVVAVNVKIGKTDFRKGSISM